MLMELARYHDRGRLDRRKEDLWYALESFKDSPSGRHAERCYRRGDERRNGRHREWRNWTGPKQHMLMLHRRSDTGRLESGALSRSRADHGSDRGCCCEEHEKAFFNFHEHLSEPA